MVERRSPKPDVAGSSPAWPEGANPGLLGSFWFGFIRRGRAAVSGKNGHGDAMKKIVQFFKDSYAELRKVVWPSREDVVSSVKVVIVSTIIFAVLLGLVDALLLVGVNLVF